ncbi:MAG: tetratricopeptide repeat protein [Bacteroidetes bacterium]|nr:tetratricopeptide repeat protein [Bacteroidota bacterium]
MLKFLQVIFILLPGLYLAQNSDSLKHLLTNADNDTLRCVLLEQLIEAEDDEKIWTGYNTQIKQIAERNLKSCRPNDLLYKSFNRYYADAFLNDAFLAQNQGNNISAFALYEKSLAISKKVNYLAGVANSLNGIGIMYNFQGNIPKALEYYHQCLKIQEQIGDKQGAAITLGNLGYLYSNQGNEAKSLESYFKSLALLKELNDKTGLARTYNNIGVRYGDSGDNDKALEYYNHGLTIYEQTGSRSGIALTLNNIGFIYFTQKKYKEALENFKKSLALREEIKDKEGMAYSLLNFARLYERQKDYSLALKYSLRSLELSRELGYPENIRRTADLLKKIYIAKSNYPKALEMFELTVKMKDSIDNIKTREATIKKQVEIDFEKKETEIKTLARAEKEKLELKANEDKKRQNIIIYSVIAGLIMMSFFLAYVFRSLQRNKKANKIISAQKKEVENQKHLVDEKQKEIVDSINYARRIQYSLLAHEEFLKKNTSDHFVLFKPKDIVSGDFYWAAEKNNRFYIAVCDSTGHGVPGAFMCLLNIGFLSEAINEKNIVEPNEVFDYVRERLISTISKEGKQDGFDGILLCYNRDTKNISYAAANNAPVIVQNGNIEFLAADKMPVGLGERKAGFSLFTIPANSHEILFLYTDGYADQFGGAKGKKFKYKPLNELLFSNYSLSTETQKIKLDDTFENWRGNLEQVDDVCILGIRF